MSLNDPLANVLSHIMTQEKKGVKSTIVHTDSRMIRSVLGLLKKHKYVGEYKVIETRKGGAIEINLIGAINKTGVIKPRYGVKVQNYEEFEKRYLPAFGFGFLIVSTNKGIMTQEEAKNENIGGKLIAYVY